MFLHSEHYHLFNYLLTPWSRVLLEKLTGLQLVKKSPPFHKTRRFITTFTSASQLSLAWASSFQFITPQTASWRPILILFSHLRLGHPNGLFPSCFHTKIWGTVIMSSLMQHYRRLGWTQYFHFQGMRSSYLKVWDGMFPFEREVSTRLQSVTPQKIWTCGKESSCYTSGWEVDGWLFACSAGVYSMGSLREKGGISTLYVSVGKNAAFVPLQCGSRYNFGTMKETVRNLAHN
jgi:hypothetical protein